MVLFGRTCPLKPMYLSVVSDPAATGQKYFAAVSNHIRSIHLLLLRSMVESVELLRRFEVRSFSAIP